MKNRNWKWLQWTVVDFMLSASAGYIKKIDWYNMNFNKKTVAPYDDAEGLIRFIIKPRSVQITKHLKV